MTKTKKHSLFFSNKSLSAFLYLIVLHLFEIYQLESECPQFRLQMQEILLKQFSENKAKPK